MATVTFNFADGVTLTGTSGDDEVTLVTGAPAGGASTTIDGRGGNDTVVFDGLLSDSGVAETFSTDTAGEFFLEDGSGTPGIGDVNDDDIVLSSVETFVFDNGTVTSNASTTTEYLLQEALSQDAGSSWSVGDVLAYDGSSVAKTTDTWSLSSVDGSALTAGNSIAVTDNGTVIGAISLNVAGDALTFTADSAFQTALDIGETADVSFDIVLSDGTNTVTETVTAVVTGTASDADNTYTGTSGDDTVNLEGGNDFAVGNDGDDTIFGSDGNDTVYAGSDDTGADDLVGGDGNDILAGGAGNDVIVGDSIASDGSTIADQGDAANDTGSNTIFGGDDDDIIAIGGYNDATDGLDTGALIEDAVGAIGGQAFGGAGNDFILGTASGDDLVGLGDGNDEAVLGSGNNTVYAGADDTGMDAVTVGNGDNEIYTGAGDDTVTSADGNDTVGLGAGNDDINAGDGDNVVYGGAGDDSIVAGSGRDDLFGGAGNDTIKAGTGDDEIYGGAGDDSLTGEAGDDVFFFAAAGGNDTITDFTTGEDLIDLSQFDTAFADLVTSSDGTDMTIYVDADTSITLELVTSVNGSDFLF